MPTTSIGAVILWSSKVRETVAFYRAMGVLFEAEDHGDGVNHAAAELGDIHFAIFEAPPGSGAQDWGSSGATMVGLAVDSIESSLRLARELGARIIQPLDSAPWGARAVVEDPDGRPVEIFQPTRNNS